MPKSIFVNLPVGDLTRSIRFYEALGATRNEQLSDETAACMAVSGAIFVMLLTHEKYRQFTALPIADPKESSQLLIALDAESRNDVDRIVAEAASAGGRADPGPTQDLGFMYGRSVADPDGHRWEVFWMDSAAASGGANAPAS